MTVGDHGPGEAREESGMSNHVMAVEDNRRAIGPEASRAFVQIAPAVLNPREAAKYIGVGRTKFFELLRDGAIPMKKSGKHTLVKVSDLDAWIEALPSAR
jgi:excisionase family DNA binding protein